MLSLLQAVLDRARNGHRYVTDRDQYQRPEHWHAGLVGDCEDHALWCRQELQLLGIASDLVLCLTEAGDGHLVCSVDGYVLDNRHKFVMRRDDLPYQWLILGQADGTWRAIVA